MNYIALPMLCLFVAFMCFIMGDGSDRSDAATISTLALLILSIVDIYRTGGEPHDVDSGSTSANANQVEYGYYDEYGKYCRTTYKKHNRIILVDDKLRGLMNKNKNIKIDDGRSKDGTGVQDANKGN